MISLTATISRPDGIFGMDTGLQLGLKVIFPLQCRAVCFEDHYWLASDVAVNRLPTPYRRFDLCSP